MANDGQIVFEVTADGKHAIADIKEITRAIQQETGKWDSAAKQSTDSIGNGFTSMLKKVAAGFSAVKIGKALLDIGSAAVSAASDLQEVQNVVDVTFGENANQIEKWSKNAASQFGLTETQAKKFSSTMGAMLKSSGLAGEQIVDVSTDLAGLAADMASFYNLDFEEAFSKIRSGMSGMTMPLKELGIDMSVDTMNAYALAQGLDKTFNQMSQSEQTMLRYQYLMQATADAQGDFARTSDGYANSMRKLQTNVDRLKTTLGTPFLDTVAGAVSALNGFLESLMPDESKRTVLDDFADINLNTETKLEQIRTTASEANLLAETLDEIAGSKADKAGSKLQQMAEGLANIDLNQGKAGIVKDFISTLAQDIPTLANIQGTSNEQAIEWLNGISKAANDLDENDAAAWTSVMNTIKEGLPGLENTDFGSNFFAALGGGFSDVEKQSTVLQWAVDQLGNKTNKTAEEQALWLETCKRLVKTIPGLSAIINTETGEVKGGTQAIKDYVKAWEDGQIKLAMIGAFEQKKSAISSRFADLPGLQLDMAVAEKRVRDSYDQLEKLYEKYGLELGFNKDGSVYRDFGRVYGLTQEDYNLLNKETDYFETLVGNAEDARKAYQLQADALKEAEQALAEMEKTIDEMDGDTQAATDAIAEFYATAENVEKVKALTNAVQEATTALADHVQGVRDSVRSAIDSTVKGFEYLGDASQRQAQRLKPIQSEIDNLDKKSKTYASDLKKLEGRMADANDIYGIGNLRKNLDSQLRFLREYKADMEKAQSMGFSNEFLAQFADGSAESAEWLHEIVKAGGDAESGQVKELNDLFASVEEGKKQLTSTLADQQLTIDQTFQTLQQKAKEAVDALNLAVPAEENAGNTIAGLASGISKHLPEVQSAVDSIINQLNRLDGWGFNIDLGGFGSINFTTSTGKKADTSGRFGVDYVPRDDYLIRAHEGERLLTAQENQIWNTLLNGGIAGYDLEALGGVMRDNIKPGGNVYLDGKMVGSVVSDRQGRSYKSMQRSGWQA